MTHTNSPAPKRAGQCPPSGLPPRILPEGTPILTPTLEQAPRRIRRSIPLPTEWAKIGGADFMPGPTNSFLSEKFRDVYKPGEIRTLYIGGCTGLARLSHTASLPIFKVSSCAEGRLEQRLFELRRDNYGAWRFADGGYYADSGWDSWFPSHLHPRLRPSPNSPVLLNERSIRVRLPSEMDAEEFDKAFDLETRKAAVDLWSMTEEARNHCAILGVDPTILQRFTEYPGWRRSPAHEICCCTIYSGADRLISLAETIILRHLASKA